MFPCSEYLAVFKKTVSSHEIFLQRIASHPVLSKDRNFHVFLEYDQDVRFFFPCFPFQVRQTVRSAVVFAGHSQNVWIYVQHQQVDTASISVR